MTNVRIETLPKRRTWGGWIQHERVYVGAKYIGKVQTRRHGKRTETITCAANAQTCVLGRDIAWLRREAGLGGARRRRR
jgi:hypothetical protein